MTPTERPRIGDFTRPTNPRKKGSVVDGNADLEEKAKPEEAATKGEETKDALDEANIPPPTEREQEAEKRISLYQEIQDQLKPITDYKAYLKELDISEEDAAQIVDDLLMKGYYEERFPLSKKIAVTLRTREQRDTIRLQTALQVQRPLYNDTMDEIITRYNMAASLVSFGRETFAFSKVTDENKVASDLFDKRLDYVERLAAPVFSRLSILLATFDRKVAAVMRNGVAENF